MSIKLDSLDRWKPLAPGDVLTLPGENPRRIRLNVNSPGRSPLYIVSDDGEMKFLAAPEFRDVVEFAAGGDVRITTTAEDVTIYTAENEPTFSIIENAEVFTQIAQRKARNPDLEHLMYLQQVNIDRRMAALAADFDAQIKAAYDAGKATIVHSDAPGTAAPEPVVAESEPDGGSEPSGAPSGSVEPAPAPVAPTA